MRAALNRKQIALASEANQLLDRLCSAKQDTTLSSAERSSLVSSCESQLQAIESRFSDLARQWTQEQAKKAAAQLESTGAAWLLDGM